jgi:hypothetical protein
LVPLEDYIIQRSSHSIIRELLVWFIPGVLLTLFVRFVAQLLNRFVTGRDLQDKAPSDAQ